MKDTLHAEATRNDVRKPSGPGGKKLAALAVALSFAGAGIGGLALWRVLEGRRIERDSHTAVEAIRKVASLTTVEMNVSSFELRKDAKNLFGFIPIKCEKTVAIFYRGKVAAGFDLQDRATFAVNVAQEPGKLGAQRRLVVELPPARVLYTDAPPPEIVVADGSLCNRFEPADFQTLSADARAAVQKRALDSGILRNAESHARELIQAVATPLGFTVEVRTRTPALTLAR